MPLATVTGVFQRLVEEGVPVRDTRSIVAALVAQAARASDPAELAELVRPALGPAIVQTLAGLRDPIAAIALVPNATLTIVGNGSERLALEKLATELSVAARVTFAGYHRDPRPFLHEADVAIACSKDEPLGLSVLETLAVGRPVIGFDGGGLPEIIANNVTGWLVTDRTASGLARAMTAACDLEASSLRTMGAEARRSAVETFSVDKMAVAYGNAYERALAPLRPAN